MSISSSRLNRLALVAHSVANEDSKSAKATRNQKRKQRSAEREKSIEHQHDAAMDRIIGKAISLGVQTIGSAFNTVLPSVSVLLTPVGGAFALLYDRKAAGDERFMGQANLSAEKHGNRADDASDDLRQARAQSRERLQQALQNQQRRSDAQGAL